MPGPSSIHQATADDLDVLLPLVQRYHAFEGFPSRSLAALTQAVLTLLQTPQLGFVLLLKGEQADVIGYIAICFGYSIEFGGRDGFVDEFFIEASHRGQGLGRMLLEAACEAARREDVQALHLEVARDNQRAQSLYLDVGFAPRSRFTLLSRDLG